MPWEVPSLPFICNSPLDSVSFQVNMCNYIQIQYHCGHFRFPVQQWCYVYERTHKKGQPN
ncbi:uncharacterized protein B0I36DRAFT_324473, partial [Microdochium trichocladiopsis]